MGGKAKNTKKQLPAAPLAVQKTVKKDEKNHLIQKRPKNFRLGGDIQPKRDLTRFVKWPKYIRLQRQKRILLQRLKVPPSINQFNHTLDKNQATAAMKLLSKYKPETRGEKKQRMMTIAKAKADGKDVKTKKPIMVKSGLKHITQLVEQKRAQLVVIAHDVDPIELIVWLPALCRKKEVPYMIIKGKARLGQLVHQKKTSCVALCNVNESDRANFEQLKQTAISLFNDNVDVRRKWGGALVGVKSRHVAERKEKILAVEAAKKANMNITV